MVMTSGDNTGFCQTNSMLRGGPPDAVASDPLHVRPLKESSLKPLETLDSRSGAPKKMGMGMALGNVEPWSWGRFFHLCEYELRIVFFRGARWLWLGLQQCWTSMEWIQRLPWTILSFCRLNLEGCVFASLAKVPKVNKSYSERKHLDHFQDILWQHSKKWDDHPCA